MDPLHVIIRRKNAAERAHDLLMGWKARPWSNNSRLKWAMLAAHYPGKGLMRYEEFLRVAEKLAVTLTRPVPLEQEDKVYDLYRAGLEAEARRIQAVDPERVKTFRKGTPRARKANWAKDAALSGRCPQCGSWTPKECGHGLADLVPNGTGGLKRRPTAALEPAGRSDDQRAVNDLARPVAPPVDGRTDASGE